MMPATIKNGLSYVTLHPCADQEWLKLPHVMLTSDDEWGPNFLDSPRNSNDETSCDTQSSLP